MKRQIKFRGMDLQGRWFYGLPCHIQTKKHSAKEGWYISNAVGIATAYDVRPETITQFTGLLDKNNKEIYEGDIVRILYNTDWPSQSPNAEGKYDMSLEDYKKSKSYVGVVAYDRYKFGLDFQGKYGNYIDSIVEGTHGEKEVIGNIYENSELLK